MRTPPSFTNRISDSDGEAKTISGDPKQILLIELVNLLGLFITHAGNAKGAQATTVMFDQIVQRLKIIEKMPNHNDAMIVRRIDTRSSVSHKPDYHILFGDLSFSGSDVSLGSGKTAGNAGHLSSALEQAFDCFAGQGISALFIQLPGNSPERIDQLRLSFNIIARFHHAVENNASITFRYFGRAMTVPLIKDRQGKPDPNLTLVAGLNGLSAINMRELLKQAEAFGMLAGDDDSQTKPTSNYDQVFRVRSLRSQLVRPLVEVNNLPWVTLEGGGEEGRHVSDDPGETRNGVVDADEVSLKESLDEKSTSDDDTPLSDARERFEAHSAPEVKLAPQHLSTIVDSSDPHVAHAIATVFGTETVSCGAREIGRYLGAATKLLRAMETAKPEGILLDELAAFLYNRLDQLPEHLLDRLTPQRQGLKIEDGGKAFLVGMVHPKLLEQLSLIKEKTQLLHKLEAVDTIGLPLSSANAVPAFERFDIGEQDGERVVEIVNFCIRGNGGPDRNSLDTELHTLGALKYPVFELLWCLLRKTSDAEEATLLLNALSLLSMSLEDPCRGIGFLMTDLFQLPSTKIERNRNAFVLINSMICGAAGGAKGYTERTPVEMLSRKKECDPAIMRFMIRRLGACRSCVRAKFDLIRMHLRGCFDCSEHSKDMCLSTSRALLAVEREGLIFLTLIGDETGRAVVRDALNFYSDVQGAPYKGMFHYQLSNLIDQMETILRAVAIVGSRADIPALKFIEQSAARWMALDSDSDHIRRVQGMLKWIPAAIRSIQVQAD